MIEVKVFVKSASEDYERLQKILVENGFEFTALPISPREYMNRHFTPPFRIGKKQKRAVLDSLGLEVKLFPKGAEKWAEKYCDFLNNETSL